MSMTCVPLMLTGHWCHREFTAFQLHCPYVLARMDPIGSVGGHCKNNSSLRLSWDHEERAMHSPAAKPEKAFEEAFDQGIRLILHQTSPGLFK
jgi:hypothetical protein